MEEKCSKAIARFLISQIPEAREKERILKYGLELMITAFIGLMLMVCVSILSGQPLAWLPFILGFAPLRTTAGGFHASSHVGCYILTTVTFAISVALALVGRMMSVQYFVISVLSFAIIIAFSPVEASNKPLSPEKRVANRRVSLLIAATELIISLLLICCGIGRVYISVFYYGILAASISIVSVKIKNFVERRLHNEG